MGRTEADIDEWTRTGVDLLRVDPGRFLALLVIAQRVALAHADPMRLALGELVMIPGGESNGSA
jgi:hypothetical protein